MTELKALRLSKNIPVKDMVEVVRKIYPKYDKTVQSKCENGDAYGIRIAKDAMEALYTAFDPKRASARRARRKDKHRLTHSIRARLEPSIYEALQQRIVDDGYATTQDWLADRIVAYLQNGDDLPEGGESVDLFC